jgi:hypothetical protein
VNQQTKQKDWGVPSAACQSRLPLFYFKKNCTDKHTRNLPSPSHITTVNTNTHKESKAKYTELLLLTAVIPTLLRSALAAV